MVAGDFECYPGPRPNGFDDVQAPKLYTINRTEEGHKGILSDIKTVEEQQKNADMQIKQL